MSPRRSVAEARETRARLLDRAADMASAEGLEGVTLGRLAEAARLSKSGVTRHFPSKQELQLETLTRGFDRFTAEVWGPAAGRTPGRERLLALCRTWTEFLAGDAFPGGCFLSSVAAEFDARPGPVRDAIAAAQRRWLGVLAGESRTAVAAGELAPGTDPEALAFQLNALALAANQARQLLGDDSGPARARELMTALVGRATPRA